MSHSSTLNLERVLPLSDRRKHPRRKPDQLIYVGMGTDNGGFVLDISEAGLSFQGIMPLSGGGQTVDVAFKLPGTNIPIRAEGQLVRPGNSEKGGGLRLLNLPAEAQLQLREWVERQEHAEAPASVNPDVWPGPIGPTTGTNDWISSLPPEQEKALAVVSPAASDGATRFNSVLAQALAQSKATESALVRKGDIGADISKMAPDGVAAKPAAVELERSTLEAPPSGGRTTSQDAQGAPAIGRAAAGIPPVTPSATSLAANESMKAVREAVLRSNGAKHHSPSRRSQIAQFAAGLAVGCVALAAIGAGLVETGRVHFNSSSPAPSASTNRGGDSPEIGTLDLGNRQATIEAPAALPDPANGGAAPVQQQPEATGTSLPAAPARTMEGATAAVRRSAAQAAKLSASHPENLSSAVPLPLNRPLAETPATPRQVSAPAPSLSAPAAAPLPEVETGAPAPVMQSTAPVRQTIASEAFPAPEPEAARKAARKPEPAAQASGAVFSSPDPAGARPSNLEPATVVLRSEPVYPPEARAANVQGSVEVLATIGKDGVPRDLRVTRGQPQLAAAAIAAISRWRYRPAMLNGQPEESLITITVNVTP
jgi:TonB family protein